MNVFIRQYKEYFAWFTTSAEAVYPEQCQGSLEELGEYYKQHPDVKNWVLVAPAIATSNRVLEFSEKERKHIQKAIPFSLEEDLLTDAAELHYVADKPAATHVNVVAIDNDTLAGWLALLASVGVRPTHCLPECKLLNPSDESRNAEWQISYRCNEFIVSTANGECVAFEEDIFPLALELLTEDFSKLPASIELIADDEAELGYALTLFPEAMQSLLTTQIIAYADRLQSQFPRQAKLWNMLKGRFAQSQQWVGVLLPWRGVIAGLLLVMTVHLVMVSIELVKYKHLQQALSIQLETEFRRAIPKGQMVDQRVQIEHELEKLQAGGTGGSFMQKMNKIGSVFAKHDIQSMNALNYERDTGEIRIDLIVDNYDKLQSVLNDLQAIGLTGEIQNSNAQGAQLRARLRITG